MVAGGLMALVALALAAHDDPPPEVPPAEQHRPTPMPDRIILTWAGDPARTQAVTWRTDASVLKARAQVAPAGPGPDFVKGARDVAATTTPLQTDLGEAHYHSVRLEALEPDRKYAYRVGDGVNWSEWFHFRTAAAGPAPLTFVYFGDAQNDIKAHWSRVVREAYGDAPKARFFLHAGDLINRSDSDANWGEWHAAGGWLNAMIPSIPCAGNHEYDGEPKALSSHWRSQFTLPKHGPAGLAETVYAIDIQGVRIVALNSNEQVEAQAEWLDRLLANNPNRWTILAFHHPIYSSAKERDNAKLRAAWQPLFDEHKVDLVLQGHDHVYARTGLERAVEANVPTGVATRDERAGTVYVVSVSGPKMYELERDPRMRRAAEDTQLYQVIIVDGPRLVYEARTAVGTLYDGFELRKRSGAPNELIERQPDGPERLRVKAEAAKSSR